MRLLQIICAILELFPKFLHCPHKPPHNPPPSDGYHQTFSNLTGATQAGDYMTYGLVDTVARKIKHDNSVDAEWLTTFEQNARLCATLFQAATSSTVRCLDRKF